MQEKTVCFLQLNSKFIHSSLAGGYIKANSKLPFVLLCRNINMDFEEVYQEVLQTNSDVVALSCYIWNIDLVKKIAQRLMAETDKTVILGGPEVSYCAEKYIGICHHIICGEGEEVFDSVASGQIKEQIVISPTIKNLDTIKTPYTEEFLLGCKNKMIYFESSRGCPFDCKYCISSLIGGVRNFSLQRVKDDLKRILKTKPRLIKFVDRTFNANLARAKQIVQHLIDIDDGNTSFHFEVAGDLFDDQLLTLLEKSRAGLFQMEIGIQSYNEDTLACVSRKTNLERVESNIARLLKNQNIHLHVDLIAGLPHEGLETFKKGFNRLFALHAHDLQLGFLKFLQGCKINEDNSIVFSENPPYEFVTTKWLTAQDKVVLETAEKGLNKLFNSGYFSTSVEFALQFFPTAFDFFVAFGEYVEAKMSLERVAESFFVMMSKIGVDTELLGQKMLFDFLVTNKVKYLPKFFKRLGGKFCCLGEQVIFEFSRHPKSGSAGCFNVLFDYTRKNPANGKYIVNNLD